MTLLRDRRPRPVARQAAEAREQADGQRAEQGKDRHFKRDDQAVRKEFDDFQIRFGLGRAQGDQSDHRDAERQRPGIEESAIPRIGDLRALRDLNANVGSVVHTGFPSVSGSGRRALSPQARGNGEPYQTGGRGADSPAGKNRNRTMGEGGVYLPIHVSTICLSSPFAFTDLMPSLIFLTRSVSDLRTAKP